MIGRGADVSVTDSNKETPLHAAVRAKQHWVSENLFRAVVLRNAAGNFASIAEERLSRWHDITSEWKQLCFSWAAGNRFGKVVEIPRGKGADVNATPVNERPTAIQAAAGGGHRDVVNFLLEHGAEINAPALPYGKTALQAAAAGGYLEIVTMFMLHVR